MSVTYDILCLDCKEVLWIGQSDYIYTTDPEINAFSKFLHKHEDHVLKFLNDNSSYDLRLGWND